MQPVLRELERMSDDRFRALYESLSDRGFGPLDGQVAKLLKFRPQAIRKLPMETRARRARLLLSGAGDAELTYELFGSYLVKKHRDLVTGFLDATGVPHQEGMIEDIDAAEPDGEKARSAAAELDGRFEREDVTLYLALCAQQWPASDALRDLWSERAGAAPAR